MWAQQTQSDIAAQQQNQEVVQGEASRSALAVKPGSPTIKDKDIVEERKITPWKRLPRYILQDQKAIWTSPFHTSKADAKWWAIFGGTTAVLIAAASGLPNNCRIQQPDCRGQVDIASGDGVFAAADQWYFFRHRSGCARWALRNRHSGFRSNSPALVSRSLSGHTSPVLLTETEMGLSGDRRALT